MSESNVFRVRFQKGKQKAFIEMLQEKTGLTLVALSGYLEINRRTLADWKREKFLMSLPALEKISEVCAVPKPKDIEILKPFWGVSKAGKIGGNAHFKKYGRVAVSEDVRKEKWEEWWKKTGRKKSMARSTKHIIIPEMSVELAEFIGILIGDGGIKPSAVTITLDAETDKAYAHFVSKRIKDLFGMMPKTYRHKTARAMNLIVNRVELVSFCHNLGLPIGNKLKQGLEIPECILQNREYARACVRGLVDTDGCFFVHGYESAGKRYSYLKIDFTSRSFPLLAHVAGILQNEGIYVKLSSRSCLRIESREGVARYMRVFGTSNPKHLKKIEDFRSRV